MNENYNGNSYTTSEDYVYNRTSNNLTSLIASRSFLVVFLGLIVTTVSAYFTVSNTAFLMKTLTPGAIIGICIFEMIAVIASSYAINKNNMPLAIGLFAAYTVLNGISLSVIFLVYDIGCIQEAFLLTALLFGVMSAFGYFTKKDLTKVGSLCMMGLIGAIIVSLANVFFFKNTGLDLLLDYLVVAIFVGLTAYDMHRMKLMSYGAVDSDVNRIALFTGMQLYLDFINLFIRLVRILGRRN